jgi:hypothetical protein
LRLVKLLSGQQSVNLTQSLPQALIRFADRVLLLNLRDEVFGLRVIGVKLQCPLELALRGGDISLAHGALTGADRISNLPETVTFLDCPHLQIAHPRIVGIQCLRFAENPDSLTKLALVKGMLAFRQHPAQLHLLLERRQLVVDFGRIGELLLEFQKGVLRLVVFPRGN